MVKIRVQVSGPPHSGKTSLIAVCAQILRSLGAKVTVQRADPQIDEKFENLEDSKQRIKEADEIIFTEMQTH